MLAIIGKIGTAGGTGYVIEYRRRHIRSLSMEGRMTICNMSIEGGARAGLIAPGRNHLRIPEGPADVAGRPGKTAIALLEDAPSDPGANTTPRSGG